MPQHIVTEDYESYIERKTWVTFIDIILVLVGPSFLIVGISELNFKYIITGVIISIIAFLMIRRRFK
jgi:hypothetical protein